jgi:hypothetical protein
MRPKSTLPFVFLLAAACAGAAPPPAAPVAPGPAPESAALPPASPAEVLAEADEAYASRLAAARGGRFDTERQIGVLEQAVLLYSQFLERAEGRPELEPAVRKSRDRIADARETIEFLRASLAAQGEPPLAPSP